MILQLDTVHPLIVPANYYQEGIWDLPHYILPNKSFILTWVLLSQPNSMAYLTQDQFKYLQLEHEEWQRSTFDNLRNSLGKNENFCSGYRKSKDGERLLYILFMQIDGIGSSRILLAEELTKAFPEGYYLAFPDRSCALVISKENNDSELVEMRNIVKEMHREATTPMSGILHESLDLALPTNWTKPIDSSFSNRLVHEIDKLRIL